MLGLRGESDIVEIHGKIALAVKELGGLPLDLSRGSEERWLLAVESVNVERIVVEEVEGFAVYFVPDFSWHCHQRGSLRRRHLSIMLAGVSDIVAFNTCLRDKPTFVRLELPSGDPSCLRFAMLDGDSVRLIRPRVPSSAMI